ncbi:multicopper oxidase [Stagonosporopsis vannaccii]|nr:multicopper oxidase [Stagonosporopsis vannaccii]
MFATLWALTILLLGAASAKVTYHEFNVTWVNRNPDGLRDRPVMGINGQWPIPALRVTKGERLVVTVRNLLGNETTSVHWHGLYMNGTAHMDGPPGVTQCEIPHGDSFVYDFRVDQPGTYWFHSHTRGQYPDGLRAPLIVHDPEDPFQGHYDEEVVLSFSDWYHEPMRSLLASFVSVTNPTGAEPVPSSALINDSQDVVVPVQSGRTYLIRMVNMAAFAGMYVWFQGKSVRVVEVDGIYSEPAEASMLYFTAGQRYSVLLSIDSDQTANIPFVASMDEELFDAIPDDLNSNVTGWLVVDKNQEFLQPLEVDAFEPLDDFTLRPLDSLVALDAVDMTVTLDLKMDNLGDGANYAFFNDITYVEPAVPALFTVMSSGEHASNPLIYGSHTNSFVLNANQTIEIVLNNNDDGKHPFHLHGHAFQVIERSEEDAGSYTIEKRSTSPSVPMRRDTVLVQPNGYAVLRFRSDNPGVWLFHCHIEWHVASGLIATFIEAPLELQKTTISPEHYELCARNHPPISTVGNAAGNTIDLLDLTGEPAPPDSLPAGFTTKGVVALIISTLNALAMIGIIAWYGMLPGPEKETGASGVEQDQDSESRPLLAEPESRAHQALAITLKKRCLSEASSTPINDVRYAQHSLSSKQPPTPSMLTRPLCCIARHSAASIPKTRVCLIPRAFSTSPPTHAAYNMPQAPKINKIEALPAEEAKWVEFQKISWQDQTGRNRVWEAANRKTRGKAGVDAVAICTVIRHPKRKPSTIIILQYRPPVDAVCVELPAGLVDDKESPSDASLRELHEETGYKGKLTFISPTIVSDPGLSSANMQLATVEVNLNEGDEEPEQALDDGEFIERVVVPLDELYERLVQYDKEGKTVDARLWHWAAGINFAKTML